MGRADALASPDPPLAAVLARTAAAVVCAAARALAVGGLALVMASAAPSAPDAEGSGAVPLAALAASVAAWAADAADLPLPAEVPPVMRASRREMALLYYGPLAATGTAAPVEALYDRGRGRILLADDWSGSTPREVSVLVHEMVHHLEAAADVVPACPAAGEARAYAVQDAWLAGFGSGLQQAFGIDPVTLRLLTRCPGFGTSGEVIRVRESRRPSSPPPGSPRFPENRPE